MPRSDLVLFVTSVDRPFTESRRAFLELIREWGKRSWSYSTRSTSWKKILRSLYRSSASSRENVRGLLGFEPEVLPVLRGLRCGAGRRMPRMLAKSRIKALEAYIVDRLDEGQVRLKLLNPLGVGLHLTKYLDVVDGADGTATGRLRRDGQHHAAACGLPR